MQAFPIGLERNHDFVGSIKALGQGQTGSVLHFFTPWFIRERSRAATLVTQIIGSNEFHILPSDIPIYVNANMLEQITEQDALVDHISTSTIAPVESNSLLDHVDFLSSVSTARNGNWKFSDGKYGGEFVHTQHGFFRAQSSTDVQFVCFPAQLWDRAVVSNNVKVARRQKSCFVQLGDGWLAVERVLACQSNQATVTRDPFVGCAHVAMVGWVVHERLDGRLVMIHHVALSSFVATVFPGSHGVLGITSIKVLRSHGSSSVVLGLLGGHFLLDNNGLGRFVGSILALCRQLGYQFSEMNVGYRTDKGDYQHCNSGRIQL
mmetsp:Transcript_16575/g.36279  ORF Transcript_16575/g.36279 Transcript_16575/m.36279 type:complete len:320 (-) Transcript_16575:183-1142(-)